MTKLRNISLFTAAALSLMSCGNSPAEKLAHEERNSKKVESNNTQSQLDIKKVSQALGNFIGKNLNSPGIHFDLESTIKGIREGAEGKPSPMSEKEYETAMKQLQQQAITAISSKNMEEANKYMKENAKTKGLVEIVPGKLQYIILQEGSGPAVAAHGTPQITYTGKYIDGTVFGNSDAAGGPITVPLDQTIPGFSKGIEGMKEGEKRRLFVHPEMGYGTNGQLLPNSLLIFDIEVVKAVSPDKDSDDYSDSDDDDDEDDSK